MKGESKWPLLSCDSCGLPIRELEEGWLEWLRGQDNKAECRSWAFRVCHKEGSCIAHAYKGAGAPLACFRGGQGIVALVSVLDAERANRASWGALFTRLYRCGVFDEG